jgi:hypothetical protein
MSANSAAVAAAISESSDQIPCCDQMFAFDAAKQFLPSSQISNGTAAQLVIVYTVERDAVHAKYDAFKVYYVDRLCPGQLLLINQPLLQRPPLWQFQHLISNLVYEPALVFSAASVRDMPNMQSLQASTTADTAVTTGCTTSSQRCVYLGVVCIAVLLLTVVWPQVVFAAYWHNSIVF